MNQQAHAALVSRAEHRKEHCPESLWVFCRKSGERNVSIQSNWEAFLKEAGLEDFHFHDLRHTCASWLVQCGVSIPNNEAAIKLLYLDLCNISKRWTMPIQNWKQAMSQLMNRFEAQFNHA